MRGLGAAALALAVVASLPGAAAGFGTTPDPLGQTAVHWKITRAALECAATPGTGLADEPGRCIEPRTMALLSGEAAKTEFGAVEAPDIDGFFEDLPHCTNGDHLAAYPSGKGLPTQAAAHRMLRACRRYLVQRLESAIHAAEGLVDAQGRIVAAAVRTSGASRSRRCQFVDRQVGLDRVEQFRAKLDVRLNVKGRAAARIIAGLLAFGGNPRAEPAKCQVLWHLGAVLHGLQDAYAHGNWTDHPQRGQGGPESPPGLGRRDLNPFMRLVRGTSEPPKGWLTTCYSLLGECEGRVDHGTFAKDNGAVSLRSQPVGRSYLTFGAAKEVRGKVAPGFQDSNFKLAAEAAVRATKDVWRSFGEELLQRFPGPRGQARGRQMLCALTHDDPVKDCFALTLSASGRHVPGTGTTLAVCSPAPVGALVEGTMSPAGGLASGAARQATVAKVGQRFPNSPSTAVGFQLEWSLRPEAVPGLYDVAVTARLGKHQVSSTASVRVPAPGPESYPTEWPFTGIITARCISYR